MDFAIIVTLTSIASFLVGLGIMMGIMELQRQRMERQLYHMFLDEMYHRLRLQNRIKELEAKDTSSDTFRKNKVTLIGKVAE